MLSARALALLAALSGGPAAAGCADVALVLAIDASGSVDHDEFTLQQRGYALALRSPRVQAAIDAAGVVEVGVILWGDSDMAPQVLPMARLAGPPAAAALADRITAMPRRVTGNTGIGRAVWTAADLIEAGGCAIRRIVNVSGDGRETGARTARWHMPLTEARRRADALGITINALAIRTDEHDLHLWYRDRLIAGPGAFVMEVTGYDSFAAAIEEKLVREIAPPALALAD